MRARVCKHTCTKVCFDDPSDGYCGRLNTEYPALQTLSLLRNDVYLEDCMHLILLASQATVIRYRERFSSLLCLLLCV